METGLGRCRGESGTGKGDITEGPGTCQVDCGIAYGLTTVQVM